MTTDMCISACGARQSTWAMLGSSNTCYCGSNYAVDGGVFLSDLSCNVACLGNKTQMCGSVNTYSLYNVTKAGVSGGGSPTPGRVGTSRPTQGAIRLLTLHLLL